MGNDHDCPSTSDASSSLNSAPDAAFLCQENSRDPLSDVLRMVKLTGAMFHLVEASYPWGVEVPPAASYAPIILPGAQHIVSYHIILEGSGWVVLPGEAPTHFEAGDVLMLAHGKPYALLSTPTQDPEYPAEATLAFFREWMTGKLPFVTREGGGGAGGVRYACGFLGCDLLPFNPVLAALPPLLHVRQAGKDSLLSRLLDLPLSEAGIPGAGGESIRLGLCELIFIEAMRQHLASLPAHGTGWLAGLRDPAIGRALAALHDAPAQAWKLNDLAQEAGLSRAAFAARFAHLVGHSPMQYLTLWRMQIAARRLADSNAKVASIGHEVGYESEAAFSRAFKKIVGLPPAQWRQKAAG